MNKNLLRRYSLFLIATISLLGSSVAIHGMDEEEDFAQTAERQAGTKGGYNLHAHNYIVTGNKEAGITNSTIRELFEAGAKQGVYNGTAQVVASLMVELTQIAILKGAEWYIQPSQEELALIKRKQQENAQMLQQQETLNTTQETLRNNSSLVSTLVDGADKLNEEKTKEMALAALMKYGQQVNLLLDIQNMTMFGIEAEQTTPTAAA